MNAEPEFCARCLQLDEACKCYASTREGDTHTEPCEECGAVMTYDYTVDEWSHENTPTAGECYTAFRWGVK